MNRQSIIDRLHAEKCSCVIAKGDSVTLCHEKGVSDLFRLLKTSQATLDGAFIADKVIGKGAAALMILGKVAEVYTDVISRPALELLESAGIPVSYGKCVPNIINRSGTGLCPVETLCLPCATAAECLPLIERFINEMKTKQNQPDMTSKTTTANHPVVYMSKDISPETIIKLYKALGREATGNVAVKISTGEPGGHNFLQPALIADFVKLVSGTIVECNTAYEGRRFSTADHIKAAEEHGFTAIAPVDIMDADGEIKFPYPEGKHLKFDIVGAHYPKYDFTVILSHFKGHAMGGFGGAVKNMSIGIASSNGKSYIHSAGKLETTEGLWDNIAEQDDFLESMAEAAKAVADHCGDRILYISVANNLSVDCDCDANPAAPEMGDIGVLASLDPIALDKACTDMVRNSPDHGKIHLIERIDSRNGMHTLDYGEKIGLGSQNYRLVNID